MKVLVILSALCAVALAAPGGLLSAPLLPKVQVAAPQVTVVKQPYTVHQPELVYRSVPVPVKAVAYTAPAVVPAPVAVVHAPAVVHTPAVVHAPAIVHAPAVVHAPVVAYHAIPPVHVL